MTVRHPFTRFGEIDLGKLQTVLSARLGRRVELLAGAPTDDEPEGVLIVEDPDTGEYLDVDPVIVAEVVVAQSAEVSEDERAIAEFDAAPTIAGKIQAWRDYLGRRVAVDRDRRERLRELVAEVQARHADRER